jgi:hypothetical protein
VARRADSILQRILPKIPVRTLNGYDVSIFRPRDYYTYTRRKQMVCHFNTTVARTLLMMSQPLN